MVNKEKELLRRILKEAAEETKVYKKTAKGDKLIDLYYNAVNCFKPFNKLQEFTNCDIDFIDKALKEFNKKNSDIVDCVEALEDLGTFNKNTGKVKENLAKYMLENGYIK